MENLKKYKKTIIIGLLIAGGLLALLQFNWGADAKGVDTLPNTEAIDSTAVIDSIATITEVVTENEDQPLKDLDNELNDQE